MVAEHGLLEQVSSIFDKLVNMVGLARNAFNRHSRGPVEELKTLQAEVVREISAALQQLEELPARKSEPDRAVRLRLQSALTHLQIIAEALSGLAEPIQKKIKDAVLFSDKAVAQVNALFDHQAGILRSLLDIIKTGNDFLKKYALEEGHKQLQACNDFATEHEARLIEGLCLPQAAPLFLALLDRLRTMCRHEVDIAHLLSRN